MIALLSSLVSAPEALELAEASGTALSQLITTAGHIRDQAWGKVLTYSPKVFLPLTNLCRDRCDYCGFRRSPGEAGEWTMSPEQVIQTLDQARAQGCIEALFCLGDSPDQFPSYRQLLSDWGYANTTDYLFWAGERALERGLLPHTNAGILAAEQMQHLKGVNVSLGLMLESVSERLCEPGMPHHHAPDKHPQIRLKMTAAAGKLGIPFTSGLLVGMGETPQERVETLVAIRQLHQAHGHIQEVIVQPFRIGSMTPLTDASEPSDEDVVRTIALARLILPPEVSVQTPPNLNATLLSQLIEAGINDFGGISPITPDYINPDHPWPHLDQLAQLCTQWGFQLQPRLPIYQQYQHRDGFLAPQLQDPVRLCQDQLSAPLPPDL
jgi:FO synthase